MSNDKPPPGTIDAELHEVLDRYRKISASSMEQLANVGEQLFGRLQAIAPDIIPDGTWNDQSQHVRDAICLLFAMVRNRTTEPLPAWRAELLHLERMKDALARVFQTADGRGWTFELTDPEKLKRIKKLADLDEVELAREKL